MSRLPCHKGVGARAAPPRPADQIMGIANHQRRSRGAGHGNAPTTGRRPPGEVPYVTPDGGHTRYYADRCYLDAPTGLVEYQIEKRKRRANRSTTTQWRREYCNRCGEIRDDVHQPRGAKAPPPERALFDRAKFINSLDLSAAIVGTYTLADFGYMSDEFPTLFPPPGGGRGGEGRRHVPTLVLHGQKGFSVEKWAAATAHQKEENGETKACTGDKDDEDGVPMRMRGGGGESSSQSQQLPETQCSGTVQFSEETKDLAKSPEGKKRPLLTYDNQTLRLPKTPKRLRNAKRPKSSEKEDDANAIGKNAGGEGKAQGGSEDDDVIVIDSDTEEEPEPKDAKREATAPKASAAKTLEFPPPVGSVADGQSSDPSLKMQQPQKDPVANAPPPASPGLPDCVVASKPPPMPEAAPTAPSVPPQTAASTLARVLGKPPRKKVMRPIFYNSGPDSSQDSSMSVDLRPSANSGAQKESENNDKPSEKQQQNQPRVGWGGIKPAEVFRGEVFFTQVLPRWCPPIPKDKPRKPSDSSEKKRASPRSNASTEYSDDDDAAAAHAAMLGAEQQKAANDDGKKTVRGVHHPKFFLLFERSGSLVVIVTTSNLSPQTSVDGSWVQRFEPKESTPRPSYIHRDGGGSSGTVDYGVPSDFGAVLTDLLQKQSEAAECGMLPDVFLRRYVAGLSSGLGGLADRYRFEDAQVHLVTTVPGDYVGGLPKRGHRDATYRPRIAYGPQRVSFILSRILNEHHIRSARAARAAATGSLGGGRMEVDQAWLPPSLITAKERLVVQPTSLGGNWTGEDLESIVRTYLQPHWTKPESEDEPRSSENGLLDLLDIVWPTMDYFEAMRRNRRAIWDEHPEEAAAIIKRLPSSKPKSKKVEGHVFLSSVSFARLDRPCLSRMALFTRAPGVMPYQSPSLHFKSICRLFQLNNNGAAPAAALNNEEIPDSKEYLSWFMLTSACLSRGAQGQPTPFRDPQSDCMSYSNFELGVLFCSRLMGDNLHDRIYASDPSHTHGCQCGKGKRWYKPGHSGKGSGNAFLESVKKVHLPIPYQLRPKLYQDDPDSDFMSHTPYMNEILDGTGCVGNMKLTPLGQQIARDAQRS